MVCRLRRWTTARGRLRGGTEPGSTLPRPGPREGAARGGNRRRSRARPRAPGGRRRRRRVAEIPRRRGKGWREAVGVAGRPRPTPAAPPPPSLSTPRIPPLTPSPCPPPSPSAAPAWPAPPRCGREQRAASRRAGALPAPRGRCRRLRRVRGRSIWALGGKVARAGRRLARAERSREAHPPSAALAAPSGARAAVPLRACRLGRGTWGGRRPRRARRAPLLGAGPTHPPLSDPPRCRRRGRPPSVAARRQGARPPYRHAAGRLWVRERREGREEERVGGLARVSRRPPPAHRPRPPPPRPQLRPCQPGRRPQGPALVRAR